jgi:hypothetical protein
MFDVAARLLSWRGFLLGLLLSLSAASLSGLLVTRKNTFHDFVRFHLAIAPESLYYPTARQIAALVDERYDPNKVMVLIGGSSVLRGVSQPTAKVWTLSLQNELGPKYIVLNLAINGGAAPGAASYMTEMLIKSGRKAIFVSDMMPGTFDPESVNPYYRYLFFEAQARGYLIPSGPRSTYLQSVMDDDRRSLQIRAVANRALNFEELWNYLGYCCVFTVYSPLMSRPWSGRQNALDPEVPPSNFKFQELPKDVDTQMFAITRGYSNLVVDQEEQRRGLRIAFPEAIRRQIIILSTGQAPFYAARLTKEEHRNLDKYYTDWEHALNEEGIATAFFDRMLSDKDHYDRVHLNETGGATLAKLIAPFIQNKAKELGYDK